MHPSPLARWLALPLSASLGACLTVAPPPPRAEPPPRESKPDMVVMRLPEPSAEARANPIPPPDAFREDMLAAHNQARAQATPQPRPALAPLSWSEEATRRAEAWASQCRFDHEPGLEDFGQNLAAATPGAWTTRQVVESWNAEAAHYDWEDNACQPGQVCGHYTQLVWRATRQVGCATRLCTRNSPFGPRIATWQLWVCNYVPPGNYEGERPY